MNYKYTIPAALIGVSIALIQTQTAFALSSGQVAKMAKQITVLIDSKSPGSGIIIKRSGNTYTVLTAGHVVASKNKAEIVTPDGKRYQLNYSTVKALPGVDLATCQFTSSNNYPVAKIGNSDQSSEGTIAYVAGFPKAKAASISSSTYNFTDGKITANASRPLKDGYALVYNNLTLPGMSGGPVFNEKGELIGVHGRGDESEAEIATSKINPEVGYIKSGFNLGIPINTFLRLSAKSGVDVGVTPPPQKVATAPKADDFLLQATDKFNKNDYRGAIADYNQALKINPNLAQAYYNRGVVRDVLGDKQSAIADYNQALKINPNFDRAYYNRGVVRHILGDKQSAIADYNQALKINPNLAQAYHNRGVVRRQLGDKQAAIADYNQAIKINPNYADAYNSRGVVRSYLGDIQGAINDYNQALKINPNNALAYLNRGSDRSYLGDKQGAINDYTQAIKINPNFAEAYNNRGIARHVLGDKQGAITDYTQAIKINPNNASAYYNRGIVRSELGDKESAIADYNQALKINPNYAEAYLNRGVVRHILGDKQEAINDYNQALKINPNFAQAYTNRGSVRYELGDKQGAINDYNQVLKINPNFAEIYNNRGIARYELGDKQGAIIDFQQAAKLYQLQGKNEAYQNTLNIIRRLQE